MRGLSSSGGTVTGRLHPSPVHGPRVTLVLFGGGDNSEERPYVEGLLSVGIWFGSLPPELGSPPNGAIPENID